MQRILKFKFVMDPRNMLINILPSNITKIHSKSFKYMVTGQTVIFTAKWKAEKTPDVKEWKNKLNEYMIITKLMSYIRTGHLQNFKKNGGNQLYD